MDFFKYFEQTTPSRHIYVFKAPNDYITTLLKQLPIAKSLDEPIYRWQLGTYISPHANFLLYILHKLSIRPL